MRKIPLTQGKFALVDDADYEWLSQWKWCAWKNQAGNFYAIRNAPRTDGKRRTIRMHQVIMGTLGKVLTDHRDGEGLNNQRHNLRTCTPCQNVRNQRKHRDGGSKYKGVHWDSARAQWAAKIYVDGRTVALGRYKSEEVAARAYDSKARECFGEFARVNQVAI